VNGEQWELLRDEVPALISAVSSTRASGVIWKPGAPRCNIFKQDAISAQYLDVLAVRPIIGTQFSADETVPTGPNTAILSYDLWHKHFWHRYQICSGAAFC